MNESYPHIGDVIVCQVEILETISLLKRQCQSGAISQFVEEPPVSEEDVLMPTVSFILQDPSREIGTFVMKVYFQFQMRH